MYDFFLRYDFLVPENFTATLERYTQHGYRVIAVAHRKLALNYAKVYKSSSVPS